MNFLCKIEIKYVVRGIKMNKYMMSIITVVYNNRKDIERVITSVLNQTYDNIEYIIIDGGSTDGTVDIIKKYSDSNIKWISEPDKGIYDALNKGIAMATGDYIYVIGSDDYLYDNEVIRKVVNCLNEEVDIFSSGIIVIDKDGTMKYAGNEGVRDRFKYDGSYMIPHPGLFVRSSLQKKGYMIQHYKLQLIINFSYLAIMMLRLDLSMNHFL